MKPTYSGFEAKKTGNFAQLPPPGAYVAEIRGVKTEESYDKSREQIVLMLEITEGEYAGRYMQVFEEQKNSFGGNVKYRGTLRLTPYMEGDSTWVKSRFEGNLWCIEQSNPGYQWDWDENKLNGKKVGINVRKNIYTGKDGNDRETTEIAQLETVDDVRNGKCRMLKDRISKKVSDTYSADGENVPLNVSGSVEVPF